MKTFEQQLLHKSNRFFSWEGIEIFVIQKRLQKSATWDFQRSNFEYAGNGGESTESWRPHRNACYRRLTFASPGIHYCSLVFARLCIMSYCSIWLFTIRKTAENLASQLFPRLFQIISFVDYCRFSSLLSFHQFCISPSFHLFPVGNDGLSRGNFTRCG